MAHELADFVLAGHPWSNGEHAGTAFEPSSKRLLRQHHSGCVLLDWDTAAAVMLPLAAGYRRVGEYLNLVTHMPMHVARCLCIN